MKTYGDLEVWLHAFLNLALKKAGVKLHVPAAISVGEDPRKSLCRGQFKSLCRGQFKSLCRGQFKSLCRGQFKSRSGGNIRRKIPPPPAGNLKEFPRFSSPSPSGYTAYATPANPIILKRVLQDMTPGGGSEDSGLLTNCATIRLSWVRLQWLKLMRCQVRHCSDVTQLPFRLLLPSCKTLPAHSSSVNLLAPEFYI